MIKSERKTNWRVALKIHRVKCENRGRERKEKEERILLMPN